MIKLDEKKLEKNFTLEQVDWNASLCGTICMD